jgi:hypothetical protein
MKVYTFHSETAEITKRYTKKQAWLHTPRNEPRFKAAPYVEVYIEDTPRKNHVTAVRVPFSELRRAMKRSV